MANREEPKGLVGNIVAIALAVGAALLIQALLIKPFKIPSPSMENTLKVGQRILVERVSPRFSEPKRFQIVVFKPPPELSCKTIPEPKEACNTAIPGKGDVYFVKRIIGMPGDRLSLVKGRTHINGKPLKEEFVNRRLISLAEDPAIQNQLDRMNEKQAKAKGLPFTSYQNCEICHLPKEIVIPKGHYFMMGDNRAQSDDSRVWGPIARKNIIGEAIITYWPPKRIGLL